MTEHGRVTVTDSIGETCPYCGTSDGTRRTSDAGRTQAWFCDRCDTTWTISVIRPDPRTAALLADLTAATQEIGRRRCTLRQVITLADDAPTITDLELRSRLLALPRPPFLAGRRSNPAPPRRVPGGQPDPRSRYHWRGIVVSEGPELRAAMRLLDQAKARGFAFERIALTPSGDPPLRGARETLEWIDEIVVNGFSTGCEATRRGRYSLVVPGGLPVVQRVSGDALTVLHTVVSDWATT